MNSNYKKSLGTILPTLAIAMLLTATLQFSSTTIYEVRAQNVTSGANQTAGGANQTASQFGNLTAADFENVRSDLREARDAIHDNLTQQAYNFLGFADNGLFGVTDDVGAQNMASFTEQLTPVRDAIQQAQDSLLQNNNSGALEQLNTADVELLAVTQMLPGGETAEEDTEE
jgi:hypothetical protein